MLMIKSIVAFIGFMIVVGCAPHQKISLEITKEQLLEKPQIRTFYDETIILKQDIPDLLKSVEKTGLTNKQAIIANHNNMWQQWQTSVDITKAKVKLVKAEGEEKTFKNWALGLSAGSALISLVSAAADVATGGYISAVAAGAAIFIDGKQDDPKRDEVIQACNSLLDQNVSVFGNFYYKWLNEINLMSDDAREFAMFKDNYTKEAQDTAIKVGQLTMKCY